MVILHHSRFQSNNRVIYNNACRRGVSHYNMIIHQNLANFSMIFCESDGLKFYQLQN